MAPFVMTKGLWHGIMQTLQWFIQLLANQSLYLPQAERKHAESSHRFISVRSWLGLLISTYTRGPTSSAIFHNVAAVANRLPSLSSSWGECDRHHLVQRNE